MEKLLIIDVDVIGIRVSAQRERSWEMKKIFKFGKTGQSSGQQPQLNLPLNVGKSQ